MAAPQTNGVLRTTLASMNIGDYIKYGIYNSSAVSDTVFSPSTLGSVYGYEELTNTPVTIGNNRYYFFYFIKADTGLLIADRILWYDVSAQYLNARNLLYGQKLNDQMLIRCLSREEWLKYITNSDLNGNITKQDVNVWHGQTGTSASVAYDGVYYIEANQNRYGSTIETSFFMAGITANSTYHALDTAIGEGTCPIFMGFSNTSGAIYSGVYGHYYLSFRPALEYVDNTKSTNIYY